MRARIQASIYPWLQAVKNRTRLGMVGVFLVSVFFMEALFSYQFLLYSRYETEELSAAISVSLRPLMMDRDKGKITAALEDIQRESPSMTQIFLLDRSGKVTMSSNPGHVGKRFDRNTDPSCLACHGDNQHHLNQSNTILMEDGRLILRSIAAEENKPECSTCHDQASTHNGKLIIDRSAVAVLAPVFRVGLVLLVGGLIITLLASRGVQHSFDRHLKNYVRQERQLQSLYELLTHLSNTINVDELRSVSAQILRNTFGLLSVDVILPGPNDEFRWVSYGEGATEVERRKFPVPDSWAGLLAAWKSSKESGVYASADSRELFLFTAFEDAPLAMFVVRKAEGAFDASEQMLALMMTEHIAASLKNAYLYHLAVTDDLTLLFARRHFDQCLARDLQRAEVQGQQVGLCLLDIDHFKQVNDLHGHSVGDQVLREMAMRLTLNLRSTDQAFRFGGEEIAVISLQSSMQNAVELAERIRETIEKESFTELGLKLTVSIGVACSNNRSDLPPRVLFEEADAALYRAKNGGRNSVVASA